MFRKQRKVKRYHNIYRGSVTSSPFFKLGASVAALAVLIAAGWFLYEPVYQSVMGIGQEKEPVSTAEQPSGTRSRNRMDSSQGCSAAGRRAKPNPPSPSRKRWKPFSCMGCICPNPFCWTAPGAVGFYPGLCFQWDQCHLL